MTAASSLASVSVRAKRLSYCRPLVLPPPQVQRDDGICRAQLGEIGLDGGGADPPIADPQGGLSGVERRHRPNHGVDLVQGLHRVPGDDLVLAVVAAGTQHQEGHGRWSGCPVDMAYEMGRRPSDSRSASGSGCQSPALASTRGLR